jgi:hypothetical protein
MRYDCSRQSPRVVLQRANAVEMESRKAHRIAGHQSAAPSRSSHEFDASDRAVGCS